MIVLRACVVADRKYVMLPGKLIHRWDESKLEFDIHSPALWYFHLKRAQRGGKPLPRMTAEGTPIAYRVFIWGGKHTGTTLFPGFSNEGEKLKMSKFGFLDENEEFWSRQFEGERERQNKASPQVT